MRTAPLRRIFRIVNGGTPTSEAANWDGDIAWATPVDLAAVDGGLLKTTDRTLSPVGLRTGSDVVPAASLIVSTRAPIGYVAQTTRETAFNQGCRGLDARDELDVRFYRYALLAAKTRLQSLGQGSTFSELTSELLGAIPLPVPKLVSQRAIADYLDTETARIDATVAAKSVLAGCLTQRLRATAQGLTQDGKRIPLRRVVGLIATGGTPHASVIDQAVGSKTCRWLSPSDLDDSMGIGPDGRRLSRAVMNLANLPWFPSDSTLVVGIGATAGRVAHLDYVATGNQQITCLATNHRMVPRFLTWQLWARRDEMRLLAPYTTLPILSNDFLASLSVWTPSIDDQQRAVSHLDALAASIEILLRNSSAQIWLLRERRQALITAAVTGQLDIPGAA